MLGDVNQRIRAAQEAVEDAQLNYNYCFVKARFDGYVTNLNISQGQYANIGQAATDRRHQELFAQSLGTLCAALRSLGGATPRYLIAPN